MRKQTPRSPRPRKHAILIQCEGSKTEPRYLSDFTKACGVTRYYAVNVKPGRGQTAVVTVEAAIAEGNRRLQGLKVYDEVWCVLDVEDIAHAATLTEAIALAGHNGIRLCLSNPSFEVWLIAHFERVTRWFEKSKSAEDYLTQTHWKQHFNYEYDKADPRLYERLAARRVTAEENSQWTLEEHCENKPCRECNASTEVYKLISRLLLSP